MAVMSFQCLSYVWNTTVLHIMYFFTRKCGYTTIFLYTHIHAGSKPFYKKYPHREVQSHGVLSVISDTQHDDQDSIVSPAQESGHEIQLQTVAQGILPYFSKTCIFLQFTATPCGNSSLLIEYTLSPNIGVPLHLADEFEPDVVKHSRSKGAARKYYYRTVHSIGQMLCHKGMHFMQCIIL